MRNTTDEKILYRCTGFDFDIAQAFFTEGKTFRSPGFIATSLDKKVCLHRFLSRHAKEQPGVLWTFHVPPGMGNGKLLKHSVTKEEGEFLFVPYTVFKVGNVEWMAYKTGRFDVKKVYHKIHLEVMKDARDESVNLPSAPWY